MGPVGATAFVVVWLLFASSILYWVIEGLSFFALRPWAFRHGPLVLRQRRPSPNFAPCSSDAIRLTKSGRFRFSGPNTAVFCFGRNWLGIRFRTMVPIKGTIEWRDGSAEICGRLPAGTVVVLTCWLLAAAVWSTLAVFAPQGSWKFLWVLPVAAALAFVMGPAFLPLERRRALQVADEILRVVR